jgi:hypothetical protein
MSASACPGQLQFLPEAAGGPTAPADASEALDVADAAPACPDIPGAVFPAQCGAALGCHKPPGPAANLDLVSPGLAARLVGVAAAGSAGVLVDPANPRASVLYTRVTLTTSPMPPGAPLGADTTACILSWIASPENGDSGTASPDAQTGTVARVACGNPASVTDRNGSLWAADVRSAAMSITGGNVVPPRNPPLSITGTMDGPLYGSERHGQDDAGHPASFTYTFKVANGRYNVSLKFAESYITAVGGRQFNVSINGQQQLTNFDIFKAAGGENTAVDKQFPVEVKS